MAQVHFELHHRHGDGTRDIRISFLCKNGKYFKESAGERTKYWDKKTERVPPNAKGATRVNDHLDAMSERLKTILNGFKAEGVRPTPDDIRASWNSERMGFWNFAWGADERGGLLADPPPRVGPTTVKRYLSGLRVLQRYAKERNKKIEFSSFGQTFADDFVNWMRECGLNDSYIKKTLKNYKSILKYAEERQAIRSAPKFEIRTSPLKAPKTYLNDSEIDLVYQRRTLYPEKLTRIIDCFVLGTQIGVRVSDLSITPEMIVQIGGEKMLDLSTRKTNTPVIIPFSSIAREILDRYEWHTPKFYEQDMNDIIKDVCHDAGITEPIICRRFKGGRVVEEITPKNEMISTHTMRRSFATNMFLKGVPIPVIMRITGHTTIKSFMEYICIDEAESAKIIRGFMK
jgi:site-specific recombinase XerD